MLPEIFLAFQFYISFDLNIVSDGPLHPMVREALSEQEIPPIALEDNAQVYIMGLVANKGDDQFDIGKKRFNSLAGDDLTIGEPRTRAYPQALWAPLMEDDQICNIPSSGHADYQTKQLECFSKLNLSCPKLRKVVSKYDFILDNFREVLDKDLIEAPRGDSLTNFSTFEFLRKANILHGLSLNFQVHCDALKENRLSLITKRNVDKTLQLRKFYRETDDLVGKVVLLVTVKEQYAWITHMHLNGLVNLTDSDADLFALQATSESGLRKVMYREIKNQVDFIKTAHKEIAEQAGEGDWINQLFYRENLTINDIAESYIEVVENSEIPISEFISNKKVSNREKQFRWWRGGNYVGEVLTAVAQPRYIDITSDFNNLDLTIRLSDIIINYPTLVQNGQFSLLPEHKRNPYDNSLPFVDKTGNWLCFHIPKEIGEDEECLYLN